ncbi:type I secretion system permease/ATPase [Pseudogemmobacter faecipullorum]|uniref:Type I secretion system permease/ATPase n=1 Tax=Pseudogemmobacter faecipullorum TaxID=2755041 RepID=A0ABS8CHV9_9RHOB|nr:type I secretion system permease/ATPase [Pseudogemmobacter faecipullorum]MCB5408735.1 type I secretion system permease/ATPase [Pseudogemmobacter faecipullorum]
MAATDSRDSLVLGLIELCRAHGITASRERLSDGLPRNAAGGLSLNASARALRRMNMSCRIATGPLGSIPPEALPVLIFGTEGEVALLEAVEADKVTLVLPDTGGGRVQQNRADAEAAYSGTFLASKPVDVVSARLGDSDPDTRHWILGPVLGNLAIYRDVFLASFVASLLAVSTAMFSMQVYDRVVPNQVFDTLWILASGVGLAILLEFLLRMMRSRLIDLSGRDLDLTLSARLFEHVANLRLAHQPRSTGAFANQVRDFSTVREFFTSGTVSAICDIPFTIIFIGIIAFVGGPVAFVVLFGAVLMVGPGLLMQARLAKMSRQNTRESAALNGLLLEAVSNLETVKAARAEGRLHRAYVQLTATMAETGVKSRELTTFLMQIAASTQQLCYGLVVVVGVYQIAAGSMTTGSLIACTLLTSRTLAPLGQVAGLLTRWQQVRAAMENLDQILELPVERPSDRHYLRAEELKGAYQIADVTYAHDKESGNVVNIRALTIRPGEHIALLGGNGAGKSTFLRLVAGLTDPATGSILIDNLALAQIDPIDRRRQIGYLPQQAALFQGTLRENLQLDHGLHSDEELLEALDAVGLGRHVRKHVRGLDMPLFSNANVSGGQRQAIGLARIILQDPRVVILDEPTSAFDQATEQHVVSFLKTWLEGRTAVIATHKRELLALTERAVVLKDGQVAHDDALGKIMALARANATGTAQNVKAVR